MFFFRRKKTEPKVERKATRSATQQRSSFRVPVEIDVRYTLRNREGERCGRATDLSSGGLRLVTDEDFEPESVLDMEFTLPDGFLAGLAVEKPVFEQTPFGLRPETVKMPPAPFAPVRISAVVLSTYYVTSTKSLAHGTKFVELEERGQEELQRYVHLRQLHQIRSRPGANE
ncbi:MAG: PilZ domain-containing protein [Candidatus Baltobacteraceae bacterium]